MKVLRLFLKKRASFNGRAKIDKKVSEEIINLAGEYLDYYLDQPWELKIPAYAKDSSFAKATEDKSVGR